MLRLRLIAALVFAIVPLCASAQTSTPLSIDFASSYDYIDEGWTQIYVWVTAGQVKAYTNVDWSYEFPASGHKDHGTMVFEPGSGGDHFNVAYPQDGMYHPPLHGTLTISYMSGGTPVTKSKNVFIWFYEPSLRVDEARVIEGDEEQTVTMRLSRPSSVPVTLNVFTTNGSAAAGSDFTLLDQAVVFGPGGSEAQVRFRAIKDGTPEGEETFQIGARSGSFQDLPYVHGGSGTIMIDDAEITAAIDPAASHVPSRNLFDLTVTLGRALHASKNYTVTIGSSDPEVAKPRQEAMQIFAGTASLVIPMETDHPGTTTVTVTFPEETAVSPITAEVNVFGGELSFDRPSAVIRKKERFSVGVHMSPPPPIPVEIGAELSRSGVVLLDGAASLDGDGNGSLTVTGVGIGTVEMSLNSGLGDVLATMEVRVIDAFSAKSLAPVAGSSSGGTPVTITGTGFAGQCTVSFGGGPAKPAVVLSETSLVATTPAHAAGRVDVTVACDSFVERLTGAYTFEKPAKGRSVRH